MKFTLKDYQEEAVGKVLVNLKKASKRWREDGDKHAVSLTATTGAGKDSLGIIYDDGGEPKIVRPDFVFFGQQGDGTFSADIIDPHGIQFGDAIPKLKGLAQYAERFGDHYRRTDAVTKIGDTFRVLDLKEAATRAAVLAATSIKALYEGAHASDYLV
jgi:hypothetical protein